MKVVHVAKMSRPSIGGIENYIYNLNQELEEIGVKYKVITTDQSFDNTASKSDNYPNTVYCKTNVSAFRNPLSFNLYQRVKEENADLIHLHSPWFFTSLIGMLARDETPVVTTTHGVQSVKGSPLTRSFSLLYRPIVKYIINNSDANILLGEQEKKRLRKDFNVDLSKIHIIPNAIPTSEFDVNPPYSFEGMCELHTRKQTVLYVSRMVDNKNPYMFLDIASQFEHLDVQFLMVGGGDPDYIHKLRKNAGDNVTILNGVSYKDLKNIYFFCDLFVFLGTWEGLPTVILEAMNARLPVISSNAGAIPDVIEDPVNGTVIENYDVDEFTEAIQKYIANPEMRKSIGGQNREKVRARYCWATVAKDIANLYETLQ